MCFALVQMKCRAYAGANRNRWGVHRSFCLSRKVLQTFTLGTFLQMEWSTAAAQCVVEAVGQIFTLDGKPLRYGKRGHNF